MSEFLVEKCDKCGQEKRRTLTPPGVLVVFDSGMSDWLKLQLGFADVKSLCPVCTVPVRELLKELFPMPDLPESDADRGPIQ
jgi:hypothetical protein